MIESRTAPSPIRRFAIDGSLAVGAAALCNALASALVTQHAWKSPTQSWIGGCCDPEQSTWYLRWAPYAIQHLANPFFTTQLNAPSGVNLAWNTPVTFISAVMSPITLLFGPIVSYNVVITASIALSACCAYLVLRRYTSGFVGPLIGGAVHGFSPYVISQAAAHIDLVAEFIPPLLLLYRRVPRVQRSKELLGPHGAAASVPRHSVWCRGGTAAAPATYIWTVAVGTSSFGISGNASGVFAREARHFRSI